MRAGDRQREAAGVSGAARLARPAVVLGRGGWLSRLVAGVAAVLGLGGAAAAGGEPAVDPVGVVWVHMQTSMGDVLLELDGERAPLSVRNFLGYVEDGGYDGTVFHRVVPGYVVQGGGFDRELRTRPARAPVKNEWQNGLLHRRGTVAMARPEPRPDGATRQFFINLADNESLDRAAEGGAGYAVFGRVAAGMETVDRIAGVETAMTQGMRSVPVEPVLIVRARRVDREEATRLAGALGVEMAWGPGGGLSVEEAAEADQGGSP